MPSERYTQDRERLTQATNAANSAEKAREIDSLTKEFREKARGIPHDEYSKYFDADKYTNKERLEATTKVATAAFERLGIDEFDLTSNKITMVEDFADIDWQKGKSREIAKNEPSIYVKPIKVEQKDRIGRSFRPPKFMESDEVTVVINLNNGNTPDNNTVLTIVAKVEDMKLKIGEGRGMYSMLQSQQQYEGAMSPPYCDELNGRMNQGELTLKDYRHEYADEHRATSGVKGLVDRLKRDDDIIAEYESKKDADITKSFEHQREARRRQEWLEGIEDNYIGLLESSRAKHKETVKQLQEEEKEHQEAVDRVTKSPQFARCKIDWNRWKTSGQLRDSERLRMMEYSLEATFSGLTKAEIIQLLES